MKIFLIVLFGLCGLLTTGGKDTETKQYGTIAMSLTGMLITVLAYMGAI